MRTCVYDVCVRVCLCAGVYVRLPVHFRLPPLHVRDVSLVVLLLRLSLRIPLPQPLHLHLKLPHSNGRRLPALSDQNTNKAAMTPAREYSATYTHFRTTYIQAYTQTYDTHHKKHCIL